MSEQKLSSASKIEAGCYVTWNRDREFIDTGQNRFALAQLQQKYGFGPFLVKDIKTKEGDVFAVISTELGDYDAELYWLQVIPVFPTPLVS